MRPSVAIGPGSNLYPFGHPELSGSFGIGVRERGPNRRRYLLTAAHVVGALCPVHDPARPTEVFGGTGRPGGSLDESVGFVDASIPRTNDADEIDIDAALVRSHEHVQIGALVRQGAVSARTRDVTAEPIGSEIVVYKRGAMEPNLTEGLLVTEPTDIEVATKLRVGSVETVSRAFLDGYFVHTTDEHPFGRDGDSGAIVVDGQDRVVGMLVALTETGKAFMFPIARILDRLRVELYP